MDHPNVITLRNMDDAMNVGNFEDFFSSFTDDIEFHMRGHNRLAGDYRGKDQLQAMFARFMEAIGEYSFDNHGYFADDERGVTLQASTAQRDGNTLELEEVFVFRFRDGKVADMWYMPYDQAAFDAWVG